MISANCFGSIHPSAVYVLLLKNVHFYVGITDNLQRRMVEHFGGKGAAYTKRYPPVDVLEIIPNATYLLETKITRDYMKNMVKTACGAANMPDRRAIYRVFISNVYQIY